MRWRRGAYRETCRDGIAEEVAELVVKGKEQGLEGKALEQFVRKQGGYRGTTSWGYKIWLSEVDEQLRGGSLRIKKQNAERERRERGQMRLFAEES